jgi:hypothetical protein
LADGVNNESKARNLIEASGFFERKYTSRFTPEVGAKNTDIKWQVK